jgi:hypothetical protein
MTKNRRLSPVTRGYARIYLSLFAVAAMLVPLLAGCGGKPKPSAPGYYDGPIEGKGGGGKNKAATPGVQ